MFFLPFNKKPSDMSNHLAQLPSMLYPKFTAPLVANSQPSAEYSIFSAGFHQP